MGDLYDFRDHPDHKERLGEWRDKWVANALSTEPADRERMREAMTGLYRSAGLDAPERHAFVRSPMAAAIAGSIAAGIWWLRENPGRHVELFGRQLT